MFLPAGRGVGVCTWVDLAAWVARSPRLRAGQRLHQEAAGRGRWRPHEHGRGAATPMARACDAGADPIQHLRLRRPLASVGCVHRI